MKSVIPVGESRTRAGGRRVREPWTILLPRPFFETAIRGAKGAADFFEHGLPLAFADVKDQALPATFPGSLTTRQQTVRRVRFSPSTVIRLC
jgi:hypothetical protein